MRWGGALLNSGVQIFVARCLWLVLAAAVLPGCRALFPTDGERFERAGVQVGQPLPEVDLTSLDGHTHPWASAWGDRPAVFIAVSRSCPVARYRMMDVRLLRDTFGEQVKLILVYTVEAHPDQDPSPYRDDGKPWLTPFNRVEGVRIRQPQTLDARRTEAQAFADQHAQGFAIGVDGLDNPAWNVLGLGPNVAVLVDHRGVVRAKHGWFDGPTMRDAVESLLAGD